MSIKSAVIQSDIQAAARHYPMIEALRALAALSVVVFHLQGLVGVTMPGPLNYIGVSGWMGVDLFFAISGLVIGQSVIRNLTRGSLQRYAVARVARIVPLHFLTCVLFVFLVDSAVFWNAPVLQTVSHALFFHNFLPSTIHAINGVNWSLAVEMQFYCLAFLIIHYLQSKSLRSWVFTLIFVYLCVLAWRSSSYFFTAADVQGHALRQHLGAQTPALFDGFATGLVMALVFNRQAPKENFNKALVLYATALLLFAASHYCYMSVRADYYGQFWSAVFLRSLVAASCCTLVLAAVYTPNSKAKWLAPTFWLGRISYGIYLWHGLLLGVVVSTTWSIQIKALAIGAGAITLAWLSYQTIELPAQAWIRRRFNRTR